MNGTRHRLPAAITGAGIPLIFGGKRNATTYHLKDERLAFKQFLILWLGGEFKRLGT